jgi:galactose mutarotase-like enzyme
MNKKTKGTIPMSKIITIQNDRLTVDISTLGAEVQSVRNTRGTEFIWHGDPAVWKGRCPILFPICGGLKNDTYTLNGKTYNQQKHGFIRFAEFTVDRVYGDTAVLSARETEETLKTFPWRFVFKVTFTLKESSLAISYTVENLDSTTMYFNVGAHEGYATPEGIEEYELVFDEEEELAVNSLSGNLIGHDKKPFMSGKVLPLKKEHFSIDAIILEELRSRAVTLRHKGGNRSVRVEYPDLDHMLVWQMCGAPYVCIEPWNGMPDFCDADGDITKKTYITPLEAGKSYTSTHTMTFTEGK